MSFSSGTVIAGWSPSGGHPDDVDLRMWNAEQESWIVAIYVLGALVGALPSGKLSRKYGRKKYLMWLALPMITGWLLCILCLSNVSTEYNKTIYIWPGGVCVTVKRHSRFFGDSNSKLKAHYKYWKRFDVIYYITSTNPDNPESVRRSAANLFMNVLLNACLKEYDLLSFYSKKKGKTRSIVKK